VRYEGAVTDEDLDELLRVLPGEFVEARTALARRFRGEGDRARADQVAKLRRPPITAWALDQVAHQHPSAVADLLAVGERLRAATTDALGGDASDLRAVRADERAATDAVVRLAIESVATTGQQATAALRQRMVTTVRAALGDDQLAHLLAAGRLVDDYEPSGFGFSAADLKAPLPPSPRRTKAGSGPATTPPSPSRAQIDRARRAQQKAERLRHVADQLDAEAAAAETRAARLRQRATAAESAAVKAEADREAP
jgi:hypothetical protein